MDAGFTEDVLEMVETIPVGRVLTYGAIADRLGRGGPRGEEIKAAVLELTCTIIGKFSNEPPLSRDNFIRMHRDIPGPQAELGGASYARMARCPRT